MKKTIWRSSVEFDEAFGDFWLKLAYLLKLDALLDFLTAKICQLNRLMDRDE